MCVCACVRVSLASDSSVTVELEVIIVKIGTVTASDMIMHHVLIILTFIQGHTYLNHEKNQSSIISERLVFLVCTCCVMYMLF